MSTEETSLDRLANEPCTACRPDSPTVTEPERTELMKELPDWTIQTIDNVDRLVGHFTFPNFAEALAFTNRIGALAEAADHHPLIITEWGSVIVHWWTHTITGLHRNDFILAARVTKARG